MRTLSCLTLCVLAGCGAPPAPSATATASLSSNWGDGRNAIVWAKQSNDSALFGLWHYDGAGRTTQDTLATPLLSGGLVSAFGDFYREGKTALLVQEWVDGSGSVDYEIWRMDGPTLLHRQTVSTSVPLNWQVVGTYDVNFDGYDDIVWWDSSSGRLSVWLMHGDQILQKTNIANIPLGGYTAVGVGKLDGLNVSILLRNKSTNVMYAAMLDVTGSFIAANLKVRGDGAVPADWQVRGVADVNGDGTDDILWHNLTTGQLSFWIMSGNFLGSYADLDRGPIEWQVMALSDYDGDGRPDVLWRNEVTGEVALWFLAPDARSVVFKDDLGHAPCDWAIQTGGRGYADNLSHCTTGKIGGSCWSGHCDNGATCAQNRCFDSNLCGVDQQLCCGTGLKCPGDGRTSDNAHLQCNSGVCEACGYQNMKCCELNRGSQNSVCPGDQLQCLNEVCVPQGQNTCTMPVKPVFTGASWSEPIAVNETIPVTIHVWNQSCNGGTVSLTAALVDDQSHTVRTQTFGFSIPAGSGQDVGWNIPGVAEGDYTLGVTVGGQTSVASDIIVVGQDVP